MRDPLPHDKEQEGRVQEGAAERGRRRRRTAARQARHDGPAGHAHGRPGPRHRTHRERLSPGGSGGRRRRSAASRRRLQQALRRLSGPRLLPVRALSGRGSCAARAAASRRDGAGAGACANRLPGLLPAQR